MNPPPIAKDWSPFVILPPGERPHRTRAIHSPEGIGDRLRITAFAEIQARDAFEWAADRFEDAPLPLRTTWRALAKAEQRHLDWLLARMRELGVGIADRPVSDELWRSLTACRSAEEFAIFMASAEERGRRAGVRFREAMAEADSVTAEIFGKIADEEVEHIQVAVRYFDFDPSLRADGLSASGGR